MTLTHIHSGHTMLGEICLTLKDRFHFYFLSMWCFQSPDVVFHLNKLLLLLLHKEDFISSGTHSKNFLVTLWTSFIKVNVHREIKSIFTIFVRDLMWEIKLSIREWIWFIVMLAPTGDQEVTMSVCPWLTCPKLPIFVFLDHQHSESIKQEFRDHSESNQTVSYRRSLKYFVLLKLN